MKIFNQQKIHDMELLKALPRGTRVAISLPNSYRLAEVLKFCFEKDLVAIPIDPRIPIEKKNFIVTHSEASAFLTEHTFEKRLRQPHKPDGTFLLIYTSGSTDDPKGVVLSKDAIIANARTVGRLHGFDKGKIHATCLPLYHCNALCMSLIGSIIYSQPFFLLENFSVSGYIQLIKDHSVRTASIVPALLEKILQEKPKVPECLDYFITAAAPLTSDQARRFYDLYGSRLVQGYGLSEAVNFSFMMPKLNDKEFIEEYIDNHPPVGLPLNHTTIKIAHDGEVLVRGCNLMTCYWKNNTATDEAFTNDGFLKTGDLGVMRGAYMVVRGRKKEVINRGGETLYPKDIEEDWRRVGLTIPLAALSVNNNILSDEIGVYAETEDYKELMELAAQSNFRPAAVQTGYILKTSVGKPQRKRMGDFLVSRSINSGAYIALLGRCLRIARAIINTGSIPQPGTRSEYITKQAFALCKSLKDDLDDRDIEGINAIALDIFESNITKILDNALTGESLMQSHKGLWRKLMNEFPMNQYAILCARFLITRGILEGNVLELGSGVGNTCDLLLPYVSDNFTRSDLGGDLNARFSKGRYMSIDFNKKLPLNALDTIFATNAIHCASDKLATVQYVFDSLKEEGSFVLAEGEPLTHAAIPWALNMFYGMFEGWWNGTGFLSRKEWLELFKKVGFKEIGWSVLRAGRHDLGGILWGKKVGGYERR